MAAVREIVQPPERIRGESHEYRVDCWNTNPSSETTLCSVIDFPEDERLPEFMIHTSAAHMLFPDNDHLRSIAENHGPAQALADLILSTPQSAISAIPIDARRQMRGWISLYADCAIPPHEIR